MIVTGNLSDAWLYVLAPIVGAIIAAVVHLGLSVLTHERPAGLRHRPSEPWVWAERSIQRRAAHIHAAIMLVGAAPSRGLAALAGASTSGDRLVPSVL
jgi:hypothetical protein